MPVHGPRQIVSSTTEPDEAGGVTPVALPTLEIIIPDTSTNPLRREWEVQLVWSAEGVTDFEAADVSVFPTTVSLAEFFYEGNIATMLMTLPDGVQDSAAFFSVAADTATFGSSTVPTAEVRQSFQFDTRPVPDPTLGNIRFTRNFGFGFNTDLDGVRVFGEFSQAARIRMLWR